MEPKRIYRSRTDCKIAGVCGGIANFLNVDPTLIRLIWVALVLFGGSGLLAYLICALVIPEEPWVDPAQ
ncbi:MAG: PspC domain-containing protein [Clostridia bacterium]|nr:PspC domain-containing protein [Clostridia bacterium]